jgi:transcription initiation factor IIF auxiliary subunit
MDKLAENLQRLQEDDLLQVVQMVHDHKTNDSYTKNDVDGEQWCDAICDSVLTS